MSPRLLAESMYTWRYCDPGNLKGSIAVSVFQHVTVCVPRGGMSGGPE